VNWVRIDLSWARFQAPGAGQFNDAYVHHVDQLVDIARARGLNVLAILWSTPSWANASSGTNSPPADPADYANAARWAASHFRGRIAAWEVWNEPNLSTFWTGTPAQYVRLLQAAYPAFKAGDPDATVVFGGLSLNDDAWLAQAYAAGAHGFFDVMATHPYQGARDAAPEYPDDGHKYWLTHVTAIRQLMVQNGDAGKNIWFTEFGWSAYSGGVGLEQQGDYFVRAIKFVRQNYPYVTHMFWYDDRNTASGNAWEDNLGLLNRDLSEKPAYAALKTFMTTPELPDPPAAPPVDPPPPPPPPPPAPEPPRPADPSSSPRRAPTAMGFVRRREGRLLRVQRAQQSAKAHRALAHVGSRRR
jgi:hypothetical protein